MKKKKKILCDIQKRDGDYNLRGQFNNNKKKNVFVKLRRVCVF